jgi:hypothetical protein
MNSRSLRCARSLMPPSLAKLCHHRWLGHRSCHLLFATIVGIPLSLTGRCGVPHPFMPPSLAVTAVAQNSFATIVGIINIPINNFRSLRCANCSMPPSLAGHRSCPKNPFTVIGDITFLLTIYGRCGVPIALCHHYALCWLVTVSGPLPLAAAEMALKPNTLFVINYIF